jgi:hypothetical protein
MSDTEEVVDPNDIDLNVDDFNKVIENSTGLNVKKVDDKCPSKDQEPKTPSNTKEYKKQALVFHPDRNPGCVEDATKKFQTLENYNNDLTKNNTQPKEMGQTNELTAPEPEHKYITIFNDLVKDNDNKLLTNEKFEQAVKDNFGDNVNVAKITAIITNSSSTSNNIDLETFTKNMEKIEELSKKSAVETNTAAVAPTAAAAPPTSTASTASTASSAAPDPTSTASSAAPDPTSTATADNAVYAIIQIDAQQKITVLDAMPDAQTLNATVSPYDLLANKTESVFAVKIVKKDNCEGATDQIKCISFGNSHYELDLSEKISDTQDNLLNSEFLSDIALLKGAESNNGAAHEVDLSETAVPESAVSETDESNNGAGSEVAASDLADTQTSRKFKKGDVVKYNGDTLSITGIGKNKDGKMSYTTTKGSRNGEDVDKTATLVNPNSGGSRKNRGQQSKKTKRKYYVYRK